MDSDRSAPVASAPSAQAVADIPDRSRAWRVTASVVFVAAWIALGYVLNLEPNTYLLIGIPLTIFFQVVVKREPLRALWLRSAPPANLTLRFVLTFATLMILPTSMLYKSFAAHAETSVRMWMIACVLGVSGAAYTLSRFGRPESSALLKCLATGGALSIGLMLLASWVRHATWSSHPVPDLARSFLQYFPVAFMLEEVTFRGAIDSFVHHPSDGQGLRSAFLVSCLWGLWHMPVAPHMNLFVPIQLMVFHCMLGVPLSLAWRRTGNLAVPCAVHAFVDAVRNTIGLM